MTPKDFNNNRRITLVSCCFIFFLFYLFSLIFFFKDLPGVLNNRSTKSAEIIMFYLIFKSKYFTLLLPFKP